MLSAASGRQIGLLLDRQGRPEMVIVGNAHSILIPELGRERAVGGRLRGLRLLHTHLTDSGLSEEDLTDMLFLRLDSMAALSVDKLGQPQTLHVAHLLPPNPENRSWEILPPRRWDRLDLDFTAMAESLEDELARGVEVKAVAGEERAPLVSVSTESRAVQEASLNELAELARTAGLSVMGRMTQRMRQMNPRPCWARARSPSWRSRPCSRTPRCSCSTAS
jgi:GTP-binding protein HflX